MVDMKLPIYNFTAVSNPIVLGIQYLIILTDCYCKYKLISLKQHGINGINGINESYSTITS